VPEYSVSLSVVTYNSENRIGEMLDSIAAHVTGVNYHIYVIDNASTDRTAEIVKSRCGQNITLVQNSENVGFGRAHNVVLDRLNSKYHVYINPDITIKEDVITAIARYLDAHPDIGIITPKVLFPSGELQVLPKKDPKFLYLLSRKSKTGMLKYKKEFEMGDKDMDSAFDIEFCTGCFMFARTGLLKELGGFDERFFMYFEDADLARRIRTRARAQYNPAFVVYHHWERASSKHIKFMWIHAKSMVQYLWKWRGR